MISVCIACYNSERMIREIVSGINETFDNHNIEEDYEIVLVNDGSSDNTWSTIVQIADGCERVIGINLSKNSGQHNALMCAYRVSKGDIIVGMDDDGEHDPSDIFLLIEKMIREDYDFVCASYDEAKKKSIFRNAGTWINEKMAEILIDKPKNYYFSSFYCMRRHIKDRIIKCCNPYPYIMGLIIKSTDRLGSVNLSVHPRKYGTSNYSWYKLLRLWINGFTAFSVKPLRFSACVGILTSLVGFCYGISIIINKLVHSDMVVAGFSSIMAVILFIGGILMMLLGIMGEYIGRVYLNINQLPQYVIREIYCKKQERIDEDSNK